VLIVAVGSWADMTMDRTAKAYPKLNKLPLTRRAQARGYFDPQGRRLIVRFGQTTAWRALSAAVMAGEAPAEVGQGENSFA
jgi:hypothetical protein